MRLDAKLRKFWLAALLAAMPVAAFGAYSQIQTYKPPAPGAWSQLYMGAGGMLTSLNIASDGTTVTRTDTYGAWIAKPRTAGWYNSLTTTSVPAVADVGSAIEIRIAPSNTAVLYQFLNEGNVYKSTDRGLTWATTNFPTQTGLSGWGDGNNLAVKQASPYMAVDPQNANVVLASAPTTNKLIYTNDGFATTTAITNGAGGIPAATTFSGASYVGGFLVCFDPTSAVSGGKTQGIFATSWGNGVYHSTDGGSTWSAINSTGYPTTATQILCDQFGNLWVVDGDNGGDKGYLNVYAHVGSSIFTGSAWTAQVGVGVISNGAVTVAVDPATATNDEAHSRIFTTNSNINFFQGSVDGGTTWFEAQTPTITAGTVGWLTNVTDPGFVKMEFDPSLSNTLLVTSGVGIWKSNPPNDGSTSWSWTEQNGKGSGTSGIEELVVNWIISPAGGYPVIFNWDRPEFTITNQAAYPSGYGPNYSNAIADAFGGDWATSDPTAITLIGFPVVGSSQVASNSSDKGATWSLWSHVPASNQGVVVASTSTNWVYFGTNNTNPEYTTDGAASAWNSLGSYFNSNYGIPTSGTENGWGFAYYNNMHIVCADRVQANTFYAHNYGPPSHTAAAGFYRSTNSGAAWSQFADISYPVFANAGITATLKCAPKLGSVDTTGHVFYNPGSGSAAGMPLYRSTNATGSFTFAAVPNVTDVVAFGFGAPKPGGGGYPTIFIYGQVSSVMGIWRSDDGEQATPTWTKISTYPGTTLATVNTVEGDSGTYGKVYVGTCCVGTLVFNP